MTRTSATQQTKVLVRCYIDFPPGSIITNVEITGQKSKVTIKEDTKFFFTASKDNKAYARMGNLCYLVWEQGKGFARILNSEEDIIKKNKINKKLLLLTR